jgi:RNA polymerase sigma-70 factor (ECF subfamily)
MDFDAFYRRSYPDLLRLAYLVTFDGEVSAEIVQEALLAAWRRWDTLAEGNPEAWEKTVVLNKCRSRWRRVRIELASKWRLAGAATAPVAVRDLDIVVALRRISPRQRQAVVLHYWGDLSVEQCAMVMRTSPRTVKQHLGRARRQLATALQAQEVPDAVSP